jgi:methylmalonyl-CoA mutase
VRAEREKAVARRKDALTGTSDFPDLAEAPVAVLDVPPVTAPAYPAARKLDALPSIRLAEPFERLRDASDRMLARTGARPKIFLANLGKLADFTTRAMFARNFFEAGGIEALTNDGFTDRQEMVAAFMRSGTKLACLCSSDQAYAKEAADAARALAAAGAHHIHLTGRPRGLEAELEAAGVRSFIYFGCDVPATLTAVYDILDSKD